MKYLKIDMKYLTVTRVKGKKSLYNFRWAIPFGSEAEDIFFSVNIVTMEKGNIQKYIRHGFIVNADKNARLKIYKTPAIKIPTNKFLVYIDSRTQALVQNKDDIYACSDYKMVHCNGND